MIRATRCCSVAPLLEQEEGTFASRARAVPPRARLDPLAALLLDLGRDDTLDRVAAANDKLFRGGLERDGAGWCVGEAGGERDGARREAELKLRVGDGRPDRVLRGGVERQAEAHVSVTAAERGTTHLMTDAPLQPAHLGGGPGRPVDPRAALVQLWRKARSLLALRLRPRLVRFEGAKDGDEEVAAGSGEERLEREKVQVRRDVLSHQRERESATREGAPCQRATARRTHHKLLREDPAAVKLAPAELLHGDAHRLAREAVGVACDDAALDRCGAAPAREEGRVDVEGVEREEEREERGGDEVAERGGEEDVLSWW